LIIVLRGNRINWKSSDRREKLNLDIKNRNANLATQHMQKAPEAG
jgi:hypothetical protein